MRDFRQDYYVGVKGLYFFSILRTIIRLGRLDSRDVRILDFGCGTGRLSQLLPGKVVGYDVIPEFSDVDDWRKVKFDVFVANAVFYLFSEKELTDFLMDLKELNSSAEILFGISRQGLLNNALKYLAGEPDAHAGTRLQPNDEIEVLSRDLEILTHASVFQLCDVYYMRFRT
jgi:SAM-dependent methyltransferase